MPLAVEARRPVSQDVPLTPFALVKTTTTAQDIAPALLMRRYRLRAYSISSAGDAVTTARILGTIGGVSTVLGHLSTDNQVGMVMVLPGFIELDVNTPLQGELTVGSENGILYELYAEVVY